MNFLEKTISVEGKTIKERIKFIAAYTGFLLLLFAIGCGKDNTLPLAINSISPTSGSKSTVVIIKGSDFGSDFYNTQVFFNDVEAAVLAVIDTEIKVIVPARAYTGLVKVLVKGRELIGPEFTYISNNEVSTLAGSSPGFADGTGKEAQFNFPPGVAVDVSGNVYVADFSNHKIRKITPEGIVTTFAGSTQGFANGVGAEAKFSNPVDVALDTSGNLYVADLGNHKVRKITPEGIVSTFAGSTAGYLDEVGELAQFNQINGITIDHTGNIYVSDKANIKIRKITPEGLVTTLAGTIAGFADGEGDVAEFNLLRGIAVDVNGNVYVADDTNDKIRKISPSGMVSTLAGGDPKGYLDGAGDVAQFNGPTGVAVDALGNVYVADYNNHKIRKITPNGMVSTLAGDVNGYSDGKADLAQFSYPYGIAVDASGTIYIADAANAKIRKITQE